MKNHIYLLSLLFFLQLLVVTSCFADGSDAGEDVVGCVNHISDGCVDYVVRADKKSKNECVVVNLMDDLININGNDVKANCAQKLHVTKKKNKSSVGDKDVTECKYDNVVITIDSITTSVGYESASYKAQINIKSNGKTQTVKGKRISGC